MWRQGIRDEHLFHSASFEDRRDRQRKDERNKGDLTLGGVRFNLIFWIKFSTSVEAVELRMMAPIPEVGVCPSTYFYGLRFSWACGRKKKERKEQGETQEYRKSISWDQYSLGLLQKLSLEVETENIGKEGSIRGCWSTQQRCPGMRIRKDKSLMSGFIKGSSGGRLISESSRGWAWKLTF